MKVKQILIVGLVMLSIFATFVAASQPVMAADPLECSILPQSICDASQAGELEQSGTWYLLIFFFNILTAGVGIVAVGAIAYAGFLYTTAQGSAEQTKKAIEVIRNAVIGLLLFAGMFAIVNFLVPGGLFSGTAQSTSDASGLRTWDRTRLSGINKENYET